MEYFYIYWFVDAIQKCNEIGFQLISEKIKMQIIIDDKTFYPVLSLEAIRY